MIRLYQVKKLNNGTTILKFSHKIKSGYKPSYTYNAALRLEQYLNHLPQDFKKKKRARPRLSQA